MTPKRSNEGETATEVGAGVVDAMLKGQCVYCKKQVNKLGKESELRKVLHVFCNDLCETGWMELGRQDQGGRIKERSEYTCKVCGIKVLTWKSRTPQNGPQPAVCSPKCRGAYLSMNKDKFFPGGETNPHFRGGMTKKDGYVTLYIDTLSNDKKKLARKMVPKGKAIPEHRLLMALHLNRPLRSNEVVYHKNGDRADNSVENLEIRVNKHPRKICDEGAAWLRKQQDEEFL